MPILRTLLWSAAQRLVTDPRVQAKAAEALRKAKPAAENVARGTLKAARDAPPLKNPGAFARTLRDTILRPR